MAGTNESNKDVIRNLLADADRGRGDLVDRQHGFGVLEQLGITPPDAEPRREALPLENPR